ncbi:MAG: cell division protein FtsQ [Xanthomonadales bacterium]|nr:cell division protein FtsQ [Xanthomonadales bacterium]
MRRIVMWSLAPLVLVALAGSVWWLGGWHDARHWPIRWLEVSGDLERLTAAQVRAAVAQQARRGFFAVDVDKARAEVEALPWVERASVSRHWPDALQISVTEQQAVARWKDHALVSGSGELFEVAGTAGMQGLTRLDGPEGRELEVFERWQRMRASLATQGLEIRSVALDPRGAWRLELASGLELLLGREDVSTRLERFLSVRSDLREMNRIASIDLRYPNGLALTRRPAEIEQLTRSSEREAPQSRPNIQAGAQPNHG